MTKYRRKETVEAVQWDGSVLALCAVEELVGDGVEADFTDPHKPITVDQCGVKHRAYPSDWICRENDELFVYCDRTFRELYGPVGNGYGQSGNNP